MTPEEFLIESGAYDGAKYIENDEDLKEWTSDFVATCGLMERYAKVKMGESGWVSVKERLPNSHEEGYWFHGVIAFFEMPDGSRYTELVQWCSNDLFVWQGMNITRYVTHWQEAPRPPKPKQL